MATNNTETEKNSLGIPAAIIIAGLLVAGGVYFGLQGAPQGLGQNTLGSTVGSENLVPTVPVATPVPEISLVSVDDDPVLGDANAPVTLIEFSDYECPYCKRHFEQTFPTLKQEYIDTGLVKLVFRDLPLPFHDPMATQEAIAANCSREQGGDEMYFRYHDELFTRTTSNGNGLTTDDLYTIGQDLSLNVDALRSCVESQKYAEEVAKDLRDANTAGATGTPTFFVGPSSESGSFEGQIIIGAVPYTSIKSVIDKFLP